MNNTTPTRHPPEVIEAAKRWINKGTLSDREINALALLIVPEIFHNFGFHDQLIITHKAGKILRDALACTEAENAELRKDKERLDWVERRNLDVVFDEGDPDVGLPCSWLVGAQNKQIARESGGIRAAIDAAREAKGNK